MHSAKQSVVIISESAYHALKRYFFEQMTRAANEMDKAQKRNKAFLEYAKELEDETIYKILPDGDQLLTPSIRRKPYAFDD